MTKKSEIEENAVSTPSKVNMSFMNWCRPATIQPHWMRLMSVCNQKGAGGYILIIVGVLFLPALAVVGALILLLWLLKR